MLNPLTPAEVVTAIGAAARDAARSEEPGNAFGRASLLSAYSGSRHLAVEIEHFDAERAVFAADVADAVQAAGLPALAPLATRLRGTSAAAPLGDLVCELLDALRADPAPGAATLRGAVQARLAHLADREVELLADAIEAGRG
ncbi:hypothetical protein FSW04_11195 [Baekduia soli]|uniref:Uncharacterized protein n=1 Tax=Baekduia soli TaxID=496014 RepID=A0A5B8U516_9ACTN|nr:hypothetical protein [Baekduia soli]QEC48077.1 hypothetical protein FSW04_11195 [Baekduia soli]